MPSQVHILCHNHFPHRCICVRFVAKYVLKNYTNTWNATLNNKNSWVWRLLNVWLVAMRQSRRRLASLLTVYKPPPRMSQRGRQKATCELDARKCLVKVRNLMSAANVVIGKLHFSSILENVTWKQEISWAWCRLPVYHGKYFGSRLSGLYTTVFLPHGSWR